jgi:DNA-directed RNA polymerase specialized sigma subunit
VYIKKGQWCVAPSIREVQMDIMSIDDSTRHLGTKAKRIARFTEVAKRLNIPREDIPNMYEATSAQWKDGFPTKKGAPHPRTASDKQLQIASQNAVKWFEDGTLVEKIHEYNKKFGVKNGVS